MSFGFVLLVASVIGGSQVSTELPIIQGLLNQVDTLILTGGDNSKATQQLDQKKEELLRATSDRRSKRAKVLRPRPLALAFAV
jgi:3-phosphoglycerate kinase